MHQVTLRVPPKAAFDFLCDPTIIEEFTKWRVVAASERFEQGASWTERRGLKTRTWTVTAYERRGLSFTAQWRSVSVRFAVKKGGRGSCNVQMHVEGDAKEVARFEKSDGDRLERWRDWLESD